MSHSNATNVAAAEPVVRDVSDELLEPLGELMDYLSGLNTALQRLIDLASEKMTGLRAADSAALQSCAAREGQLLQQLFDAAQGRAAVLARVAQALRCEDLDGLRLGALAERLPEPHASALRARNASLERAALQLQQKNKLVASVAHNLQSHIRGLFDELAAASQECLGYGPGGRPETNTTRCWVDAVG